MKLFMVLDFVEFKFYTKRNCSNNSGQKNNSIWLA